MKTHRVSVASVADALNISTRAVQKRAEKEGWRYEETAARGGRKRLYLIASLPAPVQAALAGQFLPAASVESPLLLPAGDSPPADAAVFSSRGPGGAAASSSVAQSGSTPDPRSIPSEALTALFESKPENVKAEARKRLEAVRAYQALLSRGFKFRPAVAGVAREHAISEATLTRWLALVRGKPEHLWLQLLCPAYTGRTAIADISAEAWEFLKAEYLSRERRSAASCIDRLRRAARTHPEWVIPTNRTLLRRLGGIDRMVRVYARDGRDAAQRLLPPQQRVRTVLHALQVINADGYKHNLWVRDEHGEIFRPKTVFWQDVYSGKLLAFRTGRTETTELYQLSFGDVCERFGIPHAVLLDNTLAAANKTMSGGIRHRFRFKVRENEPLGVFALFNVAVMWATPGHGQAKPIERAFGKGGIGEYVDKAPEFAGAWTGSSIADQPDYDGKQKTVPLEKLHAVIAREVEAFNARANRRGDIAKERSIDAVFDESYAATVARKPTAEQARLWLLSTEEVPVKRDGTIVLDAGRMVGERAANRYFARELLNHEGAKVCAKFDPERLHQGVHVYTADGRYIAFAECLEPAGFNDQAAARELARTRKRLLGAAKEQLQAQLRMDTLTTARMLPGNSDGAPAGGTIAAPKVVRGEFRDPLERPRYVPVERTDEERAAFAAIEAEALRPAPVNVLDMQSDAERHTYWQSLDARRRTGAPLSEHEETWWAHWQTEGFYIQLTSDEQEFERMVAARRTA